MRSSNFPSKYFVLFLHVHLITCHTLLASRYMPHATSSKCSLINEITRHTDSVTRETRASAQPPPNVPAGERNRGRIFEQAQAEASSPLVPFVSDETRTKSSSARPPTRGTMPATLFAHTSAECLPCGMANPCAATGNESVAAARPLTTKDTFAPDVVYPLTELKLVLECRRLKALTPYDPDAWENELLLAGLYERYSHIPEGLRRGFHLDIPNINRTQTPLNKDSIVTYQQEFRAIIRAELKKGRYIGPLKAKEVQDLIGPFQSSLFSIIPKPGRPGRYRVIQNYSFPHLASTKFPNASVNSYINPDNFPSTWGTFHVLALTISRLPPGSQFAIRDVSEAYRTIPIHESQWPGSVVRVAEDLFCIDTCMCFGLRPSAGAYGNLADAGLDLFRSKGIGPASRWVDDHLFIRILREHIAAYNEKRQQWHQDKGRLWYGGHVFDDGTLEEFDEDCRFPIKDLSGASPRSAEDALFSFNMADIDKISNDLAIPWEILRDKIFAHINPYIGLMWNLAQNEVFLAGEKKLKYLQAIRIWRERTAHVLINIQQLYGKLLHATLVVPKGRAYLTSLEAMLRLAAVKPFLPQRPVKRLAADLDWWEILLQKSFVGRAIPSPLLLHDPATFSDASSSTGIAIIIGNRWRVWTLRKGWQTLNGEKDIGWAEAVGFELLVQYLIQMGGSERNFKVYGDNQGVIEGWRNGRSRNTAVNSVFRRVFSLIDNSSEPYSFHPTYVTSKHNPADRPSRGVYSGTELMLPTLPIAVALRPFLIDPFVVSTNPADCDMGGDWATIIERTPISHSDIPSSAETHTTMDALYPIHELQQRDCGY